MTEDRKCPHCGTRTGTSSSWCSTCGESLTTPVRSASESRPPIVDAIQHEELTRSNSSESDVMNRYRDAYRVGRTITGMGGAIKAIGFILGALTALAALFGAGNGGFGAFIVGTCLGGIVALLFWMCGVIVAAQGQILQATLDSAVSSSPFLTDKQRAGAMGVSIP